MHSENAGRGDAVRAGTGRVPVGVVDVVVAVCRGCEEVLVAAPAVAHVVVALPVLAVVDGAEAALWRRHGVVGLEGVQILRQALSRLCTGPNFIAGTQDGY